MVAIVIIAKLSKLIGATLVCVCVRARANHRVTHKVTLLLLLTYSPYNGSHNPETQSL